MLRRRIQMRQAAGTKLAHEGKEKFPHKAPTAEDIRLRAYEIFVARACAPGDEVQDWLQAERELFSKG